MTIPQALQVAMEYHRNGRLGEAERFYRQILAVEPDHADALNLAGLIAYESGRGDMAAEMIGRAVTLRPASALYHHNRGLALASLGQTEEAIAEYRQALQLQPGYAVAADNLGATLLRAGRFEEAVAAHRRAIQMRPDFGWAWQHLASALAAMGEFDEAFACFQRAMQLEPQVPSIHQDYLTYLHYSPPATLRSLHEAHREFDRRHAAPWRAIWRRHANTPDPDRPLRIGFVSPHFGNHPVGRFLIQLLENFNPRQFHVICYSNALRNDGMTARIKAAAAEWREVSAMNDEELAQRVRDDAVDILFDLAGHTSGNRLLMFARKPAPIQITWLDYVGTTGLAAMDYIIGDPRQIPPESEHGYSEKVLRMPDDYICYDPPASAPAITPLPALAAGHVTFGSFNILAKITPRMISLWACILHRLPGSRLILKNLGLDDPAMRRRFEALFAAEGVSADRLELLGWSPSHEVLACYHRVDIGLDTFPYNGGLTTCEAIWMGVPVVTCPGEIFASRHGLAHLTAAGLSETVVENLDQYVEMAVSLANDVPRLQTLRAGMRERIATSPLCDGPRFAGHFMTLLREIWQRWVASDL